jgi:hypothetical protein
MSVRNCEEIGPILQEIVSRLIANDRLCRLLYFTDRNPFGALYPKLKDKFEDVKTEEDAENKWKSIKKKDIYEKLIKVVPRIGAKELDNSIVAIRVARGAKDFNNN